MSATESCQMLSTMFDTLSVSGPSHKTRSLNFPTTTNLITVVSTTSTPNMYIVHSPSSGGSTYIRPIVFLENQDSFYTIFISVPVLLIVTARNSREKIFWKSSSKTFNLLQHFAVAYFLLYCLTATRWNQIQWFQLDHVWNRVCFFLLKLKFYYKGNIIMLTPYDLHRHYTQYLPLLLFDAISWSFGSVTIYFHAFLSNFGMRLIRRATIFLNVSTPY